MNDSPVPCWKRRGLEVGCVDLAEVGREESRRYTVQLDLELP